MVMAQVALGPKHIGSHFMLEVYNKSSRVESVNESLLKFRRLTYQFDGHIFVGIEVFSQPQLSEVPTADFFTHTEVWTNH